MGKEIICTDINGKKVSVPVSKLNFRPSVYGILINEKREVLMIRHNGRYCFPGGGVEIGERISDALARETFEETGLKILSSKILECGDSFFILPYVDKPIHSILMFFLCEFEQGKINNDNADEFEKMYAEKPEWVKIEDILKMDNLVFPQTKEMLEKLSHS